MSRIIVLCLAFLAFAFQGEAQRKRKKKEQRPVSENIVQTNRTELPVSYEDPPYKVVSAEENGIFIFRDTDNFEKGTQEYEVIRYDSTLLQTWVTRFRLNQQFTLKGYEYHQQRFYMMFNSRNSANNSILIVELNPKTGDTTMHQVQNIIPIQYSQFIVIGRTAVFGGYTDLLPTVYTYNLDNKKFRVIPGFYNKRSQLLEIKGNQDGMSFNVLTAERNFRKRNMIVMKTISTSGETLKKLEIQPEGNKNLIFARSMMRGKGEDFFIAGTYSDSRSEYSRGIFVAKLNDERRDDVEVKYYNYADFENFFDYLRDKRESRVRSRIARRKSIGKRNKFNYRLLVHDVIPNGENYMIIGEAFYPKYSNTAPSNLSSSFTGMGAFTSGSSYFVGYKFTHAVAFEFTPEGSLVWDNSFELEDVLSYDLDQKVHVKINGPKTVMSYSYENELRTKILVNGEIEEGEAFTTVALKYADDEFSDRLSQDSFLQPWYDDWFFAYGIQRIQNNKNLQVEPNRRVFYINKFRVN
jgi:hypothetical protein